MAAGGGFFDRKGMADALGEARRGFATMRRVIFALMLRDTRARYSESAIGFGQALIDPIIELFILLAFFAIVRGRTAPIAVPLPVFLVTGLFPFSIWRSAVNKGASAHTAGKPLIAYPQITLVDFIIAGVLLEAATILVVMQIFIIGMVIFYGQSLFEFYDQPLQILLSFGALLYLSIGSAFLSSALSQLVPLWELLSGWVTRLLWMGSGVFFTLSSLPGGLKSFAIYNPLAHLLDWIRSALLTAYNSQVYSVSFVMISATVIMFLGLGGLRIIDVVGRVASTAKGRG